MKHHLYILNNILYIISNLLSQVFFSKISGRLIKKSEAFGDIKGSLKNNLAELALRFKGQ